MARHPADEVETVATAETLLEIVEFLKNSEGAGITEMATELGYAKSTVHRHVSTLESLGYLVTTDDGYRLGLRFLELGRQAQRRHRGYRLAKDKVEEIATETGERVQFIVEEHSQAVYVWRSHGERAVRTDPGVGSRIPLYATAAGKSILAQLPEPELEELIEQFEFEPLTAKTITDPTELRDELETIRDRGYSFNREENLESLRAVGVPVLGADDEVIGALSVSGPSHRLKGDRFEEELPDLLLGAANELQLNIAYS